MQELLKKKYNALKELCELDTSIVDIDIISILKKSICKFLEQCNNPAIWCYGKHTKMLMADFMFELKKVHYIIDNGIENKKDSGFELIDESKIYEKEIDGVIISSRIYKEEIIHNLKVNYSDIKYLDIYEEFEKAGIHLKEDYYMTMHPYNRYYELNRLQRLLRKEENNQSCQEILKKVIQVYIEIKDFQSAILYTKKLIGLSGEKWETALLKQLMEIHELQLEAMHKIDENNVVMLCVDGLRRKEVSEKYLKNLCIYIHHKMYYFSNAYSVSTSTFESLLPAYSENDDLRTHYYQTNVIPHNGCRFINEAKRQKRKIFFYTDATDYVKDDTILVVPKWQSATEKLWNFLLDAVDEKNGLFYIHILYESHFSYPSPYITGEIVAEGTSILFDYLENNGGKIRTDYRRQQKESLKYLDDVMVPLIEKLKCRMVLYADHGNILVDNGADMSSIEETKYTFHEDLIQVPFAIKSPEMGVKVDDSLISIMELNNVVTALMNKREYLPETKEFIKVLRSEIYNPDFIYLYMKSNNKRGLLAFELFIFKEGYKLAVYSDGSVELYRSEFDDKVDDIQMTKRFLNRIQDRITVCDLKQIVW